MDIAAEFERLLEEMEWGDVVDTFQAVVNDIVGDTSGPLPPASPCGPSPSPLPPPAIPVDLGFDSELEDILSGGYGGCIPPATSPDSFKQPSVANEMLGYTSGPLPPPSSHGPLPSPLPPPAIPVEPGFDAELVEILSGGYGGGIPPPHRFEQPLVAPPGLNVRQAAPIIYQQPLYDQNVMQLGQGYSQAGPYSQNLQYQWPAYGCPGPSNVCAPPQQYNNVPVVMGIPPHLRDHVVPFKILKEGILYRLPRAPAPAPAPAAPPLVPPVSQKRNREAQKDDDRPYIKKPPNAFMLFRKEQRPNVIAELNITESATVNTILGQRWQALSKEEQAKYFEEADRERRLHEQRYPDWSPRDNYGKKKKRTRTKDSTRAEASASKPDMVTQQAKKQCVTPVQTAAMASSTSQAAAMEAAHTWTGVTRAPTFPTVPVRGAPMSSTTTQTILVKLPDREIPFTLPVCNLSNLPPVNDGAEIASRHSAASAAFF